MSPQKIPKKLPPSSSSSSSRRKNSRWQAETLAANPAANDPKSSNSVEIPRPTLPPPSTPAASGDGLERRPIVLHDGVVRYYYALPPDYPVGPAPLDRRLPPQEEDYWSYLGLDEQRGPPPALKRKREDEYDWLRESVRRYGNPSAVGEDGLDSLGKARALDEYDRHRESVRRYGNPSADGEDGLDSLGKADGLDSLGKAQALDEYDRHRESVRRYGNPSADGEDGLDSLGKARALEEYDRHRESVMRYGNPNDDVRFENFGKEMKRASGEDGLYLSGEVRGINKAFLTCTKLINESLAERVRYLEDGKTGHLQCMVCGRTSKTFSRVHDLIMHAYTCEISELRIDHLGLHKALCVLMGWNYAMAPDTSRTYQSLSADEAAANKEDLIVWPPTVIVHNINTGRRKDGRMDGMSDKEVDMKLKELGFTGGTAKSLYGKGGHLGIAAVRFASNPTGLKEAERLAEHFKKDKHGREGWAHVEASQTSSDERSPVMTKVDKKTGKKKNIIYGYLATASDLEKVDIDTRKRAVIMSRRESDPSN